MRRARFALPALLALTMFSSGCSYNSLQTLDETINQAQGQIKVQLQRRADLIGNLVQTVKGITKQEDTVFIGIANARAKLSGAIGSNDVAAMGQANAAMNAPLSRLLAVQEAYPDLKSSANFRALQDELTGTENRIAQARTDYNGAVEQFNAKIRQFPTNITAKMFHMGTPRPYFSVSDSSVNSAPKVDFSH
jgi:LemA protein